MQLKLAGGREGGPAARLGGVGLTVVDGCVDGDTL